MVESCKHNIYDLEVIIVVNMSLACEHFMRYREYPCMQFMIKLWGVTNNSNSSD